MRAIAALLVVFNHCYFSNFPTPPSNSLFRYATVWMRTGHFAVAIFIVLSGYSLMIGVARNDGLLRGGGTTFIKKRFKRIIPPYWCAVVLTVVLILTVLGRKTGTYWDSNLPLSWTGVFIHTVLLQDVTTVRAPNYVFWSIAIEWQIYFAFPIALMICRRIGFFKGLVISAVLGEALLFTIGHLVNLLVFIKPFFLLFLMGVAACDITVGRRAIPLRHRIPWRLVALFLGLIAAGGTVFNTTMVSSNAASMLDIALGGAVASLLIVTFDHAGGWLRRILSWRPLAFVGTFSYSLYLTHTNIVQLVWQYVVHPLGLSHGASLILTDLLGVPAALVFAYAFFLVAERPFLSGFTKNTERGELARRRAASTSPLGQAG